MFEIFSNLEFGNILLMPVYIFKLGPDLALKPVENC